MHNFKEEVSRHGTAGALQNSRSQPPLCRGQASVQYQLPGHELRAAATRHMEYLDSAATYCTMPLALSLDLASSARSDGIQYKAGIHQVCACPTPAATGG